MYADFGFYCTVYMGKEIAGDDFPRLSARASDFLDSYSAARSHADEDAVKMAACAVAEAWKVVEDGGEVVSQSVGRWSKTYASGQKKSRFELLTEAARMYLGPAGLMRTVEWA